MVECLPHMLEVLGSILLTVNSMAYVLSLSLLAASVSPGIALSGSVFSIHPRASHAHLFFTLCLTAYLVALAGLTSYMDL